MTLRQQAILAVALILIGLTGNRAVAEPIISGKPASQWIEQLGDSDDNYKFYAANALAKCGPPCSDALPALRNQLENTAIHPRTRVAIADSILKISPAPEPDVISTLIDIIQEELQVHRSVPGLYLQALGEAGARAEGAVPLLQSLCSHWAGSVQYAAGEALWRIQGRRCHESRSEGGTGEFKPGFVQVPTPAPVPRSRCRPCETEQPDGSCRQWRACY